MSCLDTITSFNRRMLLRPYSTMGTRADAELLLWQIAEKPEVFQDLAAAIMRTQMGGLSQSGILISSHRPNAHSMKFVFLPCDGEEEDEDERLVIDPTESKWLFMFIPLSKHANGINCHRQRVRV